MKLVLASTSPYRKMLLERLGHPFECVKPQVDESAYKDGALTPELLAQTLAQVKAQDVHQLHPEALIIGGDQVAECGGEILSKPGSFEKAVVQLQKLQGKTHRLITSVYLQGPVNGHGFTNITELKMRSLNLGQIEHYLKRDTPYDCAGSYKWEEAGVTLFESITTSDPNAIVGLPLMELQTHLLRLLK